MECPIGRPRAPRTTIVMMQSANGDGSMLVAQPRGVRLRRPAAPDRDDDQPAIAADARDEEDDIDRIHPVYRYVQIRRALDLHEADIGIRGGQRDTIERDKYDSGDDRHDPAGEIGEP